MSNIPTRFALNLVRSVISNFPFPEISPIAAISYSAVSVTNLYPVFISPPVIVAPFVSTILYVLFTVILLLNSSIEVPTGTFVMYFSLSFTVYVFDVIIVFDVSVFLVTILLPFHPYLCV